MHVWTVNDVPRMNAMIGRGVDHFITDNPKLLTEVIQKRAEMSNAEKALLEIAEIAENWC